MTMDELYKIIESRKHNTPSNSYVASLLAQGSDRVIQKVGEEAIELVIAAKNRGKDEIVGEAADLLFHTLILLADQDVAMDDLKRELDRRRR